MQNQARKNAVFAVLISTLYSTALLTSTGVLMQNFLSSIGFESDSIYIHSSIYQAANVLAIMLCAKWADGGNIIRRTALVHLPIGVLYLFYIPLCFTKSADPFSFVFLIAVAVLHAVITGMRTVCEYKLPYYVYTRTGYGTVSALSGVIASFAAFAVGALMAMLAKHFPYETLMLIAFIISALFLIAAFLFQLKMRVIPDSEAMLTADKEKKDVPRVSVRAMLKSPIFLRLLPANLLRGFASGLTTVLAAVAVGIGYDEQTRTVLVSVQSIALLSSSLLFAFLSRKLSPRLPILVGSLTFLLLPIILLGNDFLFLAVSFLVIFGRNFVDYGAPVILLRAVPTEIAGPYNAWRMCLHNGGAFLSTFIAAFLPIEIMLALTIVAQIISGILFFSSGILRAVAPIRYHRHAPRI